MILTERTTYAFTELCNLMSFGIFILVAATFRMCLYQCSAGFLKILKLLIRKCGRELAEKQDNHLTKPVYFASQEGEQLILK